MTEIFAHQLGHWQIDALAFGLLAEGAVFTVFPEEVIYVALGVLCRAGRVSPAEAIVSAMTGVLIANATTVWLGGALGWALVERRPFSLIFGRAGFARRLRAALSSMQSSARSVIFITRFTPLIRGPVYFAAGISGVGLKTTVPVDFAAALIHVPVLICAGMLIRDPDGLLRGIFRVAPAVGAAVLVALAIRAAARRYSRSSTLTTPEISR